MCIFSSNPCAFSPPCRNLHKVEHSQLLPVPFPFLPWTLFPCFTGIFARAEVRTTETMKRKRYLRRSWLLSTFGGGGRRYLGRLSDMPSPCSPSPQIAPPGLRPHSPPQQTRKSKVFVPFFRILIIFTIFKNVPLRFGEFKQKWH